MPVILLDRILLPSLRVYTAISVLLLSISVYYAVQVTSDPNWKTNSTSASSQGLGAGSSTLHDRELNQTDSNHARNDTRTLINQITETITFMIQEPLCIWVSNFDF